MFLGYMKKIKDNKSSENQTISLMLATIDGPNDFVCDLVCTGEVS